MLYAGPEAGYDAWRVYPDASLGASMLEPGEDAVARTFLSAPPAGDTDEIRMQAADGEWVASDELTMKISSTTTPYSPSGLGIHGPPTKRVILRLSTSSQGKESAFLVQIGKALISN